MNDKEISVTITREIAVLSSDTGGWHLELNEVSWNGASPKLDLRRWASGHTRSGKGVTLTRDQALCLFGALKKELLE